MRTQKSMKGDSEYTTHTTRSHGLKHSNLSAEAPTAAYVQPARKTEIAHCAITFEAETKNSRANQREFKRIPFSLLHSLRLHSCHL